MSGILGMSEILEMSGILGMIKILGMSRMPKMLGVSEILRDAKDSWDD